MLNSKSAYLKVTLKTGIMALPLNHEKIIVILLSSNFLWKSSSCRYHTVVK